MKNLNGDGKICFVALQLCQKKKNKLMLLYIVQIQPVVPDP